MKIYLSAGHGGTDPGSIGSGYQEKDLTRKIVVALRDELQAKGHAITVRNFATNEYEEVLSTNFKGHDLVISVHINSANDPKATGMETWISSSYPQNSKAPAQKIVDALCSSTGLTNRGVKSEDWRIIYLAGKQGVDAVLLEVGFIVNSNDMAIVNSKMTEMAKAVAASLSGESAPAPNPTPTPSAKEKIVSRWNETGSVNFTQTGPVYSEPNSVGANPIVSYSKGETLNKYVECVKTDKYLYLKYARSAGGYGYLRFRAINADGSYGPAVGTIPGGATPTPAPEKIVKRYPQTGSVQNMVRRAPVYSAPNSNGATPIVWYEIGETLNRYDEVVETEKFVYVKYTRSSGGHGYLQLRTRDGNKYGPAAGKIV